MGFGLSGHLKQFLGLINRKSSTQTESDPLLFKQVVNNHESRLPVGLVVCYLLTITPDTEIAP